MSSHILFLHQVPYFDHESGASPEPQQCRAAHEFACADGRRCVPLAWVCNDEPDCDDASDEQGCAAAAQPAGNVSSRLL
ncbi:Suppressor of tumorigenicity 14 protein [Eumeta japonica]|uniref:Suppressor of tumorigenicity 14 protein n=1 Tax=Eumeta variegata TaxID=151549 RepID=A0A4C1WR80_EUMVA|nr:Suppressor of tumorigenicity 14 protein [Eumeta japonica]